MALDARTVVFIITLSTVLISLGLALVARGPLGQVKAVSHWAYATAVQALGWIITGLLRGVVPDVLSVVLGNGCIVLSLIFYMAIIAEFLQQRFSLRYWYLGLLLLLPTLAYFTSIQNDVAIRTAIISLMFTSIAYRSVMLLASTRSQAMPSCRFMIGLYAFCGSFMLVRVGYFLFVSTDPNQLP